MGGAQRVGEVLDSERASFALPDKIPYYITVPMNPPSAERQKAPLLLYLLIVSAVALVLGWGAAEKGPPRWDDSWYLAAAVRLFDRFAEQGLAGYWQGFEHALGDKAPLIAVLPFPFFCLLGRTTYVTYLVNSAACIVLGIALYRLCRRFFDNRVSLLAVLFTLTAPLVAGLSRLFLVEYWLTALVVASLAVLADWEATGRDRGLAALGLLCGLGLLMKITFPLFAGPVVAVVLWRKHGRRLGRLAWDVILIAAPAVLVAGPWYGHNWEAVTHRSFQETYFVPTHATDHQPLVRMALDYLLVLVNEGLSVVHWAAAAAGLALWAARVRRNVLGGALYYVVPWVAALPIFAVSENRDLRLVAPLIPALAIATAVLFDGVLERLGSARQWLTAAVTVAVVGITVGQAFDLFGRPTLRLGRWVIFKWETGYAFAPNPQYWPLGELLERLGGRERLGAGSKLIVGIGADSWSLNSNNLALQAALSKLPMEFHTTAYTSNRNLVRRIMSRTQYFVMKDGGTQQPVSRFEGGPMTRDFLLHGPLFREAPELGLDAPDGGRIRVFENASAGRDLFAPAGQPVTLPDLPQVDLNFGNHLQVTGLRFTERDGLFTLALRWRCRNRVDAAYLAFAHVVDAQGKLIEGMDHEILKGSPPVNAWQPGDEGYEARYLALPASAVRGAQLRLGLYHPDTGLRVPLWASTFPVKDDYTAAVVEPNREPESRYVFQMQPAPAVACDVEFERGIRLTGYSLDRGGSTVWLRLHWRIPRGVRQRLYFFGHGVATQAPDTKILLGLDQDLALDRRHESRWGPPLVVTQDVVRDVSQLDPGVKLIRAGVFDMDKPLDRLAVRRSTLPMSREQKAIFLPY